MRRMNKIKWKLCGGGDIGQKKERRVRENLEN